MYKWIVLATAALLLIPALPAVISPAVLFSDSPVCHSFAGENGMKLVNDTLNWTYRGVHPQTAGMAIILGKMNRFANNPTFYVVDRLIQLSDTYQGVPTIEIFQNIRIWFTKNRIVYMATSPTVGINFTGEATAMQNDNIPLYKIKDDLWHRFILNCDIEDGNYQSFIESEIDWNTCPTFYHGLDVFYGAVRSNTDIWITNAGGGVNGGWPTFFRPVYTMGRVRSLTPDPPYNQIFRQGYIENYPELSFDDYWFHLAAMKHRHLVIPLSPENQNKILFVTVNQNSYTSLLGTIVQTGIDTLEVYNSYPPGGGEPIFTNVIARYDTTWTTGPAGLVYHDKVMIVDATLWIRGTFAGTQMWYSTGNMYLNDDILLSGTPPEHTPDGAIIHPGGFIQYIGPINLHDKVALVSRKQILIQYGFKDPVDNLRKKPNCDGDIEGIRIYASLYAMGRSFNSRQDGVFTFEYQHPHGSTPDYQIGNTIYRKIDLHRFRYPQTSIIHGWPTLGHPTHNYNLDYPYYNPLWPERSPYLRRGTVRLYGLIAQRKKGFLCRDYSSSIYPNPNNVWNINQDYCGGPVSTTPFTIPPLNEVQLSTQNAPGATGTGIGYNKAYFRDNRIKGDTFPVNPFGFGLRYSIISDFQEYYNYQDEFYISLSDTVRTKSLALRHNVTALHLNNTVYSSTVAPMQLAYHHYSDNSEGSRILKAQINSANNVLLHQLSVKYLPEMSLLFHGHPRKMRKFFSAYQPSGKALRDRF